MNRGYGQKGRDAKKKVALFARTTFCRFNKLLNYLAITICCATFVFP